VTVESYALQGGHAATGRKVLDLGAQALTHFETLFGPYPFPRLALVEMPLVGGAGGIEFPLLLGVASMLYGPPPGGGGWLDQELTASGPMLDDMLEFVVAHEVAHEWWAALVGSDPAAHPVVDEALAQYSAVLYWERQHGAAAATQVADTQVAANYHLFRLLGGQDAAADQPAEAFDDMLAYAGLVYGKAPFFYRAAREALGETRFLATLKRYARDFAFRQATAASFIQTVQRVSLKHAPTVAELQQRWWREAHGDEDLGRPSWSDLLLQFAPPGSPEGEKLRGLLEALEPLLDLFGK